MSGIELLDSEMSRFFFSFFLFFFLILFGGNTREASIVLSFGEDGDVEGGVGGCI